MKVHVSSTFLIHLHVLQIHAPLPFDIIFTNFPLNLMQSKGIFNVLVDKVVYESFLVVCKMDKNDGKISWQGYDKGMTRLRMMTEIHDPKVQGYQVETPITTFKTKWPTSCAPMGPPTCALTLRIVLVFAQNSLSTLIYVAHKYVRNIFNKQLKGRNHDGYVIAELIVIGLCHSISSMVSLML